MDGLLDRDPELAELDSRIELTLAGRGCLAVVEGPAGIGKSRLLAEARGRAQESMRVLSARGGELEGEYPFGVVRQLFDAELADPERRAALLGGAAAPAAPVFGAVGDAEESRGASFASLHGLFWLATGLAEERPLLLCVDDLHWCDRPSLMFLAYLTRRIESQPVLLLTTLREAEPGTDPALLAEIVHDPAAVRVRPGPLGEAAVAAILERGLGSEPAPAFLAACREATGGNPLLLSQLVTALRGEGVRPDAEHVGRVTDIGPRAVSRSVLVRLARLPEETRAVARAVAVLGDGAALPEVLALAGVDEAGAAEATRRLAQAEILRPEPPLGFVHPLVRDAVYHELSPGERELEHARAAALLRDGGAALDRVAAQLLHTSPRGEAWAAELMWEAGRAAMQAGAAESASAYLRRALDELPGDGEGRLLLELGAAEALTRGAPAQEHLARAYEELSDPAERGLAAALLGRTLLFMGAPEEAAATAQRAAGELPEELAEMRRGLEALESMTVFFGAGQGERLSRLHAHRTPPGTAAGAGTRGLASIAAWEALCSDGTAAQCSELALAALAGGALREADPALLPFGAIVALVVAGRPEVVDIWEEFLADAHRRGSLLSASSVHLWHGYSHLRRGDLAAAEESLATADEMFTLWGHDEYARINSRSMMAEVMCEQGRFEEAERLLALVGEVPLGTHATSNWLTARFALLSATNRAEEALEASELLAAQCAAVPDPSRLWWRSLRAEALDRLDRGEEGVELARGQLREARAFGAPLWTGRALRALGTLEREEGIETLREAVAVLEGSTARLEQAKALAALGAALRRARQPSAAREPLRRALELAGTCEAGALSEWVRGELHATGARPRSDALSGVESLTPSERRVVDLAAAGRTNREVAQELYVTPKTVEVHLSNAYRKLGIRSRRELGGALAAAAPASP